MMETSSRSLPCPSDAEPKLSIVLPCYNEARNIPELLSCYARIWPTDIRAELILVDNGSTDDTRDVLLRELARPDRAFARSVTVDKNQGYGFGVLTGLEAAKGEFLAMSHADMQCPPDDVFAAYQLIARQNNAEAVVIKGQRGWRGLGPALLTGGMSALASTVLGTSMRDINAQPKLFHRRHLSQLSDAPLGFQFDLYLLYKAQLQNMYILQLPVRVNPRKHGQSSWNFGVLSRWRQIWSMTRFIFGLRLGVTKQ